MMHGGRRCVEGAMLADARGSGAHQREVGGARRRAKGQSSSTLRDRSLPVHEGRSLLAQRRWRSPTCGEGMGVASMEGVGVADHRRSYVEAILSSCPPARYIS
jgi:hypothetical protein